MSLPSAPPAAEQNAYHTIERLAKLAHYCVDGLGLRSGQQVNSELHRYCRENGITAPWALLACISSYVSGEMRKTTPMSEPDTIG